MRRFGDPLVVDYSWGNDEEIAGRHFLAIFTNRKNSFPLQHILHLVHCGMTV